jgi:hypothetical protein
MDGAARSSGALEESFEVEGKTYTLKDPGYQAFMEDAEAFIVARRPNPLVQAAEAISELDRTLAPSVQIEQQEAIRLIAESAMMNRNRAVGSFAPSLKALQKHRRYSRRWPKRRGKRLQTRSYPPESARCPGWSK